MNLGSISKDHVTLANDVTLAIANANMSSQWNASSQGSLAKFYVPFIGHAAQLMKVRLFLRLLSLIL